MRIPTGGMGLVVAVAFCGCAQRHAGPLPDPAAAGTNSVPGDRKLIITPLDTLNGSVSSVNSNLRFVVLTFPVGQMPALHQRLSVYRGGLKVAELTVTGPQRDESIVADIAAGEVSVGDEVRSE